MLYILILINHFPYLQFLFTLNTHLARIETLYSIVLAFAAIFQLFSTIFSLFGKCKV